MGWIQFVDACQMAHTVGKETGRAGAAIEMQGMKPSWSYVSGGWVWRYKTSAEAPHAPILHWNMVLCSMQILQCLTIDKTQRVLGLHCQNSRNLEDEIKMSFPSVHVEIQDHLSQIGRTKSVLAYIPCHGKGICCFLTQWLFGLSAAISLFHSNRRTFENMWSMKPNFV